MTSDTSPSSYNNNGNTYPQAALGPTLTVATIQEKAPRTIDTSTIKTSSDLSDLKKKDAFMYYSIPAMKKARMMGRDLDITDMALTPANATTSAIVERQTRISFESSDIDIEGILDVMAQSEAGFGEQNGSGQGDDLFMSFFGKM